LEPLDKFQTVKITATSSSIYNAAPTKVVEESNSFELTFANPCIDPDYVTIEPDVLLNKIYELYESDPIGFQFSHD